MTFFRGFAHFGVTALVILALAATGAVANAPGSELPSYLQKKIAAGEALTTGESQLVQQFQELSLVDFRAGQRFIPPAGASHRPPRNPLDDYVSSPVDYDWVDISGIGIPLNLTLDDYSDVLELGFDFDYFDTPRTQIVVGSHGLVTFDVSQAQNFPPFVNTNLPNPDMPNDAIYVFWDDNSSQDVGQIYYYSDTVEGRFIVSWDGVGHYLMPDEQHWFQLILSDDGAITMNYQSNEVNTSATIGIENADASEGLEILFDGNGWLPTAESAVIVTQADGVPSPVTNLAASVLDHDVTLTWLDPTTDTNGNPITLDSIQVWLGAPGAGVRIGLVNPGVQTFTHVGAPDGNLFYYVRAYAEPFFSAARSVNAVVGDPTYDQDFEVNNGGWAPTPETGGWEWGEPTDPAGPQAHSGTNVWGTVLGGNYPNGACFSLDLNLGAVIMEPSATVEFWMWYESDQFYDGCNFQISVDAGDTWQVVTPVGGYPQANVFGNLCIGEGIPCWAGFNNEWRYVVIPIGDFVGTLPVFRFLFGSTEFSVTHPGFFIDDVQVWGLEAQIDGPPNSVSNLQAVGTDTSATLTWVDPTTDVTGNPIVVDSVQVWLGHPNQGGAHVGTVNPGVQTFVHEDAPSGNLTYFVRTYNNSFAGSFTSVTVIVGTPSYAENFDVTDGMWVAEPVDGWEWGAPGGVAPHSDPNVWAAGLSGAYPNSADWYLTLNPSLAINTPTATVEFWINYITENWWDGANFQISIDDGATWSIIEPVGGYPINPMWNGEPGWSGQSNGWLYVILPIGAWSGEVPLFRFHFSSDPSVTLTGLYFDDMLIWGLQEPVFATVSGTVSLDGGAGNVTQAVVRSNGLGAPSTNPAANGTYTIDSVIVGERRVRASLGGYHADSLQVTVTEGGITGVDFVLRRLNPPQPTNLIGSVNSGTGQVTLNWDNSTDALVDSFRVYRKLAADQNWVLIHTRPTSDDTDLLTIDGIYQYSVSAVDYGVTPPAVESERSTAVTVLYGELPPAFVSANGNFDDRIRLNWLPPGLNQSYQLAYDDSSAEAWYSVFGQGQPNGTMDHFAVLFTPPSSDSAGYPLAIQTVNLYLETSTVVPNVYVAPDAGGAPDLENAYMTWNDVSTTEEPGWLTCNAEGQVLLPDDSDFWVVMQFPPGIPGPQNGSDANFPDGRSYWTYEFTWPSWNQWWSHDWMYRVWLGGEPGWGTVLSVGEPSGYSARRIPTGGTAPTPEMIKMSGDELDKLSKASGPVRVESKAPSTGKGLAAKNPFPVAMSSQLEKSNVAPPLAYQQRPGGGRALDDIEFYKIYRDGTLLATDVEEPPYDDVVGSANENVSHTYWVRAHYDNNQDSDTSNHATRAANMAPGEPTGLDGDPIGSTQMHLTWTDPAVNSDGTPCVDLASVRVFRDGTLIGTVAAGVQTYTDTPPEADMFYTWTVRGIDEVPNVGPTSEGFIGAVVSPWEEQDYEWIDISGMGASVVQCDDCFEGPFDLGFDFEYYGQTYNSVYICSNGWLSIVPPPWGANDIPCIPDPSIPNGIIAGFLDDLLPSGGECRYYADAGDEQFIVSWVNCPHWSTGELYTFEIILGSDGSILFEYQTIPDNTSTVIGVENEDGSMGLGIHCQADGPFTPIDGSAVGFWAGPSGELQGIVRQFGTNNPIESIRVEAQELPEFTFTDATGFYSLPLDPGVYSVRFSKQGYCDTLFTNILIEDDFSTVRNVIMRSPQAQFSVTSISEETWPGHDWATVFQITNNGGQCPLDFAISDTSAWLSTNPASGSVPPNGSMDVTVIMSPVGLPPGSEHLSALNIQHEANGSPYTIPVTMSISVEADRPHALPTEFALYQNYPNPFNAQTSIRFDVPQESRVKLVLFNVNGQEVATVVDAQYPVGRHSINYEAADLPSGMYLMKLEAGSYTSMKKMLLLK